ncbi:MAG TPA: apolipoprotein N-acyltransferase [Thermoanaerobaculia bacterium]
MDATPPTSTTSQSPHPWRAAAAAVVSGILFALAFPPFEWVVLLPVALVPWLASLWVEESRRRAIFSGLLFGLAFWCLSIPWIVYVVTHYGGQGSVMGVVCLLILATILAEWPALVAGGTVACAPAGSLRRLAVFPLLWMASEHARTFVYKGFPWNLTGHALFRHPAWIQSASIWGVYGLGFAVVGTSALIAAAVVQRNLRPGIAAAVLVAAIGIGGASRLARPPQPARSISVALVQPNLSEEDKEEPGGSAKSYRIVLDQALEASRARADLIVLPESALVPLYWQGSEILRRDLVRVADECCLVLFNDIEEEASGRYYNVARLLGPEGLRGRPYRKVHLVPFGEYVPLPRVFFFVRQISNVIGEFSAARMPTLLESDGVRIGMGVCYEITYPEIARIEARDGANLLVTISNDSWYGRAGAQAQHFAGAVIRAVETRRYLLRAAITGISGIVDEKGRIRSELPDGRRGTVNGQARLIESPTAWVRWGFWIPRAADVAAAAVLLFGLVRWVAERRVSPARRKAKKESLHSDL